MVLARDHIRCCVDEVIEPKQGDKTKKLIDENIEMAKGREIPAWIALDPKTLKGSAMKIPEREEMALGFNEHLVVELYSK